MGKAGLIALTAALCLLGFGRVRADEAYDPGTSHPTLEVAANVGGDKLATYNPLFGGHDTLYAGKSLAVDFGVQHNFAGSDWSLKATAGIQKGFIPTHTGGPTFTRYPLDLLLLDNQGRWHFGFGLSYHANPKLLQGSSGPDVAFHDALGGVLEAQYRIFGFRYTNIRYTSSGPCPGRCSYDGSTLGLYLNFVF